MKNKIKKANIKLMRIVTSSLQGVLYKLSTIVSFQQCLISKISTEILELFYSRV